MHCKWSKEKRVARYSFKLENIKKYFHSPEKNPSGYKFKIHRRSSEKFDQYYEP